MAGSTDGALKNPVASCPLGGWVGARSAASVCSTCRVRELDSSGEAELALGAVLPQGYIYSAGTLATVVRQTLICHCTTLTYVLLPVLR